MGKRKKNQIIDTGRPDTLRTGSEPALPFTQADLFIKYSPYVLYALLIMLTVAAYANVFSCGFIEAYDDEEFVTKNLMVLQGLTWRGLKWSLTSFLTGNWHPLTWWSHMFDVAVYGMNPTGHHVTNLVLHIVNSLLLYSLLIRITGYRYRSFIVAAIFAIHPLHVESVAWVSERKDLLSTAFGLAALHFYTHYVQTRRTTYYLALFVFLCLSLMSKPMLVTFPFLLLALDYWPLFRFRDESWYAVVREKIPLLIPVLAISIVTVEAQKSVGAITIRSIPDRIFSSFDAYLVYLRKFFAPYDLTAFYPYVPVSMLRALIAALILAGISFGVWRYRRAAPWLVTGWLWFLGLLVPVIGIISVGTQAYADRYTYLPAVGLCIMSVWLIAVLYEKAGFPSWVGAVSAALVIVVCSLITLKQVGYWENGFTLNARDLEIVKGNWHAHLNLGAMLVERKRYDEGIEHYKAALLNHPPSAANIYHNLGVAYERKGDKSLALDYFRTTIQMSPAQDKGYLGLARILGGSGDTVGALSAIRQGLNNVSNNWLLLSKEAYLLHKTGDIAAADRAYRQAIAKEPYAVENYVNLGILLMQQGKNSEFAALVGQLRHISPLEADNLSKSFEIR